MSQQSRTGVQHRLRAWACAAALAAVACGAGAAQERVTASAGSARGERYQSVGGSTGLYQPATRGAVLASRPMDLPQGSAAGDAVFASGFEQGETGT